MATPYIKFKSKFESQFMSRTVIVDGLVREYFDTALAEYGLELSDLTYDEINDQVEENLKSSEVLLIGKLMYKAYLNQQLDKYMKMQSMVGENLSVTGLGDTKKTMESRYRLIIEEISRLFNKLKDSSYVD